MKIVDFVKNSISTICAKYLNENNEIEYLPIFYIAGSQTLPPPLPPEEEAELINKLSEEDNLQTRQILVERNLRLVVYIAKKFDNTGVGVEDLISIGTIGLIKAINSYNPEKNIKLATYASRCIENEILMFLRKSSQQKNEISIDEPLNVDWDGNELLISDILSCDEDSVNCNIERESEHKLLLKAVSRLSGREREIMELRFGLNGECEHTQKQVADKLKISQSYISRLEKKIISRLKKDLEMSNFI